MAKTLRGYILITFVVCCVSFAILVTSLSTKSWVTATLDLTEEKYDVNYGLFSGTLSYTVWETPFINSIELACIPSENVCAWSCKPTSEERDQDVNDLFYNVDRANKACGKTLSFRTHLGKEREQWDEETLASFSFTSDLTSTASSDGSDVEEHLPDQRFVNLGVWASTCTALVLALVFSVVGAVAAVVNTAANPAYTIAAVPGLYLWNFLAAVFGLLSMILWGSMYGAVLKENVAINQTITGVSRGTSILGMSYWIIIASIVMHLANIGVLYFREVLIVRNPEPPTINPIEDDDDRVIIY